MSKFKTGLTLAGVILVALLLAGIGTYATETDDDYTIKASVNKDCSGTPWFAGVEKGFFEEGGVNFVDVGQIPGPQRNTALVAGQIDVVDADPQGLINMLKAGVSVKAVAQSGDEPTDGDINKEHMHWVVLEDSPLQTPEDILKQNGKVKISVISLGICADTQNNALLRKYNIPTDKIEYVVIPDAQAEQALRQGLVDIAVLHPPFYFAAEKHGGVRILASSKEAFGAAGGTTLLIFRDEFIEEHPETVRKFAKAYKDTEKWANENREKAGKLTADDIGLEEAAVHYYSSTGEINETQLQYWIDALVTDDVIEKGEYKPEDLYTDEFKDTW
jgi:ABC-type nitrate/sulfonate/bicarbonate transport system substrate-binding protein